MAHCYVLNKIVEEYINSRTDRLLQPPPTHTHTKKKQQWEKRHLILLCMVLHWTEGAQESVYHLFILVCNPDVLNEEDWRDSMFDTILV